MGKTKTAFVSDLPQESKTSEQKYKEKQAKKAAEQAKHAEEKVHISGLKGGQRVKVVGAEEVTTPEPQESKEKTKKIVEKIRSKKYVEAKKKVEAGKSYSISDAVSLLKTISYSSFDGTVEVHLVLKKAGISANITLPHSSGKTKKIEVANEETIKKLTSGKIDFDVLLATADMMPKLVPFAKLLGPKGLMPNPKNGTIIKSVKDVDKFGGNTLNLKTEKEAPLVHTAVAKLSQKDKEIEENIETVIKGFGGNKQVIRAFIKSTMSPSIKLQIS